MISYNFKNSFDPSNSKAFQPSFQINYVDTPFTVKSDGLTLKRYLYTNTTNAPDFTGLTNLTLVDTLKTNIVGFYSADGAMTGFHNTDNFALHYTGYFYSDHPAGMGSVFYYFKALGFGSIRVSYIPAGALPSQPSYILGRKGYATLSKDSVDSSTNNYINLAPQTWYQFDVYYYTTLGESGFTLLWANSYYGLDRYVPVSAGVCSSKNSFKSSTTLPDVIKVDRSDEEGGVSSLTFSVPLVASGSSNDGYYYNSYWNKYCHSTTSVGFNKFRMVEFKAGYRPTTYPTDADDLITKFVGHIETIKTVRGKNNDYIEVNCVGFENFFKQSLNLNYPDIYDYWNAGYAGLSVSDFNPDGIGCPCTYDGWEINEAYKSLCIRSGIDPTLFLRKRKYFNYSNVVTSGTWLIEETSPQSVVLDTALNYGNSMVVNSSDVGSTPDDEYILKSNFGNTLFDYINNITDVYGWQWGCDAYYDGAPYLKSNNNPYQIKKIKTDGTFGGNAWTKGTDLNTLSGCYYQTNNATDYCQFSFTGKKANLVTVNNTDSGVETTITDYNSSIPRITVSSSSGFNIGNIVIIETLEGEESGEIDDIVGNNINLVTSLSENPKINGYLRLATFSAEIRRGTSWSTAATVQTTYHSCYFYNDYDRLILPTGNKDNTPYYNTSTRYYYDGIDPQTNINPCSINLISNVAYDNYLVRITRLSNVQAGSTNYLRVDGLMVYAEDSNQVVRTYYTGDSVKDGTVVSLSVTDSGVDLRNDTIVVGRLLGAEVPGNDGERVLNPNNPTSEYIISRATDVASIYDPDAINYVGMPRQTIQIAPEIASYDRARYWSTTFINRYRNPGKQPEYEIIGDPLIEKKDCIAIYDEGKGTVDTFNKFWITSIDESYEKKNYLAKINTTSYEPWESYTPRLTPDIADYNNLPMINISLTTTTGTWETGLPEGTQYYDPYSYDDIGKKIVIKYDLVTEGYVRIDIYSTESSDILIATLLNPTGSNGPEGWMRQDVGKNYIVTWDGVDLYGEWNKYCTNDDTYSIGKNYYAHEGRSPYNNKYGKFRIKFTVIRRQTAIPNVRWSDDTNILGTSGYIYTRRANVSSLDVTCYPKNSLFNESGTLISPISCYSDSQYYLGSPMTAKIVMSDTSNNTEARTAIGNYYPLGPLDEHYLSNRKSQINITIRPCILINGAWKLVGDSAYRFSNNFKIKDPIPVSSLSFNKYTNIERYFSMTQFGYRYNSYEEYVGGDWVNTIKNAQSGYIFMGIYLIVEIDARDKSGRKCITRCPNTQQNSLALTVSDTFWLMWIDDISPKPMDSGRNYLWSFVDTTKYPDIKYINSDGNNIFSYNYTDINTNNIITKDSKVPVVQVYPKVDTGGYEWGY